MLKTLPILLAALLLAAAPARAAGPLTTRQADALPADTVRDELMQQLSGEMELIRPPCYPLHGCGLTTYVVRTKPHSVDIPDLCRSDVMRLQFEPVEGAGQDGDGPMRPRGFTSGSVYFFLKDPPAAPFYQTLRPSSAEATAACRQPSGEARAVFAAGDDGQAYEGYQAYLTLLQAVKDGAAFDCVYTEALDDRPACLAALKALRRQDLTRVGACADYETDTVRWTCKAVLAGRLTLGVYFQDKGGGPKVVRVIAGLVPPQVD